jgi:polar amino acid transport system substrate-binding protein
VSPSRFLVLLMLLMQLGPAQAGSRALRVGGFIVAPLMTGEQNQPIGGALPAFILQEIAPHTDITFVWLPPMAFKRAYVGLKDGSIDLILLVSAPKGTMPNIGRFDWGYLETVPHLAVRPDSPIRAIDSLDQLAGMGLGWMGGSRLPDELAHVTINWQLIHTPNWQSLNLRKLAIGRVEAVFFGNQYSPVYFADKENIDIRMVPLPMPLQRFEMAYSLKTDKALIVEFEKLALKAFKGDRFKHYLEKYRD